MRRARTSRAAASPSAAPPATRRCRRGGVAGGGGARPARRRRLAARAGERGQWWRNGRERPRRRRCRRPCCRLRQLRRQASPPGLLSASPAASLAATRRRDAGGGVARSALAADEARLRSHPAVDLRAEADAGGWKARLRAMIADGAFDWRHAGDGGAAGALSPPARGSGGCAGRGRRRCRRRCRGAEAQAEPVEEAPPHSSPRSTWSPSSSARLDLVKEVFARNRGGCGNRAFQCHQRRCAPRRSGQWRCRGRQRTRLDFSPRPPITGWRCPSAWLSGRGARAGHSLAGQLGWQGAPTRIDYPSPGSPSSWNPAAASSTSSSPAWAGCSASSACRPCCGGDHARLSRRAFRRIRLRSHFR